MERGLLLALFILSGAVFLFIFKLRQFSKVNIIFILSVFLITAVYQYLYHNYKLTDSSAILLILSLIILCTVLYSIKTSQQSKQLQNQLNALQKVEHSLHTGLSNKTTISAIINILNKTVQSDAVSVFILDQKKNHTKQLVSLNLNKRLQQYFGNSNNNHYIADVIRKYKSIYTTVLSKNSNDEFLQKIKDEGFNTCLMAPIILKGGRPSGALTLYTQRTKKFTKSELRLIKTISNQIGILIDRSELIEKIQQINFESVRALVEAIESRDPYTKGHSVQVAELAFNIGQAMNFSTRELTLIEFSGLLHDIGKIAIPEIILNKTAKLNNEEWKIIKKHTILSARIIEPISTLRIICDWILYHHERWDGTGYPEGRKGRQIPLQSRILTICDTFSAMTSDRPYRKALSRERTKQELITMAGTQFDPELVTLFLEIVFNSKKSGGRPTRRLGS